MHKCGFISYLYIWNESKDTILKDKISLVCDKLQFQLIQYSQGNKIGEHFQSQIIEVEP